MMMVVVVSPLVTVYPRARQGMRSQIMLIIGAQMIGLGVKQPDIGKRISDLRILRPTGWLIRV